MLDVGTDSVPTSNDQLGEELIGILPKHIHSYKYPNSVGACDGSSTEVYRMISGLSAEDTTGYGIIHRDVGTNVEMGITIRPPSISVTMWKRVS